MTQLADDMDRYIRTGDLRGLTLVKTRDDLMMRHLDNLPLTDGERALLRTLNALLSSEPAERIRRARGH